MDGNVPAANGREAARIVDRDGASPWIVVCDHASNFVPPELRGLGLAPEDLRRHIAWDPGALPVARALARRLGAALVESCVSRLVVDCNRPLDAPDLIAEVSETTVIPGNAGLSQADRARRVAISHAPFHAALDALVEDRVKSGRAVALLAIHSFTPVYRGVARPWHVGVIHDEDERVAGALIAGLRSIAGIEVGVNRPYSPADRVYYTLERHARSRGLPCAMIEIRNDEIGDATAQELWAERLAAALPGIEEPGPENGEATAEDPEGISRRA